MNSLELNRPGVEHFVRSDFVKTVAGKPSELLPGRTQVSEECFNCPKCKTKAKAPEHGIHDVCDCGLQWVAYGNSLYLWTRESIV